MKIKKTFKIIFLSLILLNAISEKFSPQIKDFTTGKISYETLQMKELKNETIKLSEKEISLGEGISILYENIKYDCSSELNFPCNFDEYLTQNDSDFLKEKDEFLTKINNNKLNSKENCFVLQAKSDDKTISTYLICNLEKNQGKNLKKTVKKKKKIINFYKKKNRLGIIIIETNSQVRN